MAYDINGKSQNIKVLEEYIGENVYDCEKEKILLSLKRKIHREKMDKFDNLKIKTL